MNEIPFDQWIEIPDEKVKKKGRAEFVYRPSNYPGPLAIDAIVSKEPMTINFSHQNEWIMQVTKEGKLLFNREAFPEATLDEFTQKVIYVLENCFRVKFEKI